VQTYSELLGYLRPAFDNPGCSECWNVNCGNMRPF
jgi:hypothetical protein